MFTIIPQFFPKMKKKKKIWIANLNNLHLLIPFFHHYWNTIEKNLLASNLIYDISCNILNERTCARLCYSSHSPYFHTLHSVPFQCMLVFNTTLTYVQLQRKSNKNMHKWKTTKWGLECKRKKYSLHVSFVNTIYPLLKNEEKSLNTNACLNFVNYFLSTLEKWKHLQIKILFHCYYFLTK